MEHDIKDTNVMADINVTPMVDVMLVLLIIFMVVTPALMAGFQAEMPKGINLIQKPDDEERTELGIDPQGAYYINKKPVPSCGPRAVDAEPSAECQEEMIRILTAEYERHPEDRVLFVKAHASLQYGELLRAMELARDAGAVVLAAVTETPADAQQED